MPIIYNSDRLQKQNIFNPVATFNMARKRPLWHPTTDQEILLRICLTDNKNEAIKYWKQWKNTNNISNLQNESYLLLQSAISNLLLLGVPLSQKLRNISRHTTARNLVAMHISQKLAKEFNKHKIPLYAMKAVALYAKDIYPHGNTRAMNDIDLYVNDTYFKSALNSMLKANWVKVTYDNHSVSLVSNSFPCKVDLHRKPVWFQLSPQVISKIEQDTEIISFKNSKLRIMKPELQLVHILIHGARYGVNDYSSNTSSGAPHLRWIIDSHYLIKTYQIDWKKVKKWSKSFETVIQVKEALKLLQQSFNIPIPSDVITDLEKMPKTRTQKLHAYYSMAYAQPKLFKIPRHLRASFHAWLLQNHTPGYINTLTFNTYMKEFGHFLKAGFSLDKNQSIPKFIVKKILSKPKLLLP